MALVSRLAIREADHTKVPASPRSFVTHTATHPAGRSAKPARRESLPRFLAPPRLEVRAILTQRQEETCEETVNFLPGGRVGTFMPPSPERHLGTEGENLRIALALVAKLVLAIGAVLGVVSLAVAVLVGDMGGSLAVTLNAATTRAPTCLRGRRRNARVYPRRHGGVCTIILLSGSRFGAPVPGPACPNQ